jgi:hypothetical protein
MNLSVAFDNHETTNAVDGLKKEKKRIFGNAKAFSSTFR